ncbi:MAG: hypothetical protein ACSLEN_03445 [Candidatus Malihini olakiniferum]
MCWAQSVDLSAQGNTTLLAGNNPNLFVTGYSAIDSSNDNKKDDHYLTARMHTGKKMTLAANGDSIANGTDFSSDNNMMLSSGGKMELNAVSNHIYREEEKMLANYWVRKERQRTSHYPLSLSYDMEKLFIYTTTEGISDSQIFAKNNGLKTLAR